MVKAPIEFRRYLMRVQAGDNDFQARRDADRDDDGFKPNLGGKRGTSSLAYTSSWPNKEDVSFGVFCCETTWGYKVGTEKEGPCP